jgi:glycopeptide antibiotics resistance protein
MRDLVEIVLLFFPLGFLLAVRIRPGKGTLWRITVIGVALSFRGEFYQIFCVHRHPNITDILMNANGTLAGAWLAMALSTYPW